jgi:tRNA A37 methylthiotransferase MiaB
VCSFCIVPFTRGRERSRPMDSILKEVEQLSKEGYKEITLLGQNVNSYHDKEGEGEGETKLSNDGFKTIYKTKRGGGVRFTELMERVSNINKNIRIRFTSPHPKDYPQDVLPSSLTL